MAVSNVNIKNFLTAPLRAIDFQKAFANALQVKEQEILEINKQQLDRGIDSKGQSLGRYANFKYKNRFQPVDLKLTGSFRNKFTLGIHKKHAEIFSQDEKESILEKKYGKDIFGISEQYKANVAELIAPVIGEEIKRQLGI